MDKGPPEVAVFSGVNGAELARFLAFDAKLKGGVRVAAGDVDGDGRAEILAAPAKGKGTEVRAFDGVTLEEKTRFLAFNPDFKKGVFVAGVRR
jgi:serralysin